MLGIVESKTEYNKRNKSTLEIDVINNHLVDARKSAVNKDDETIDDENAKPRVHQNCHPKMPKIIRKNKDRWLGWPGNENVTQNRINFISGTPHFKCAPCRVGSENQELEQFEIHEHPEARVIEHSVSAWANTVLFHPTKYGSLRLCVEYRKLNTMKIKDSYLLPRMDECIDLLGETKVVVALEA